MEVELGDMRHETIMYKATIRDYQASDKENKIRIEEVNSIVLICNAYFWLINLSIYLFSLKKPSSQPIQKAAHNDKPLKISTMN